MERKKPQYNYVRRKNKKLVTVIEPIKNQLVQIHKNHSIYSEEVKK